MSLVRLLVKSMFTSNKGRRLVNRDYPSYPRSTIREVKVSRSKKGYTSYTAEEMKREFDILDAGVGRKRK